MNKTEKNKVTMYYAVNAVLSSHQQIIDSIAPLAESVRSFRNYLNEIMERAQISAGTIGVTAAKNNALDDVVECTFLISNALYSFGRRTNNEALAPYTITAEKITALGQSIDSYRHYADSKDTRFAESKAAREVLFNLFADADELLREDIDTLVELVKNNNSDFYNQYFAARTIKDIGGSPKAKAKVAEAIVVDSTRVPETVQ
jgi:hypothetical protein